MNHSFPAIHTGGFSGRSDRRRSMQLLTFANAPGRRMSSALSQKNHAPFAFAKPLLNASLCPPSGSTSPSWMMTSKSLPIPCAHRDAKASARYGRPPLTGTTQLNSGHFTPATPPSANSKIAPPTPSRPSCFARAHLHSERSPCTAAAARRRSASRSPSARG